MKIPRLKAAKVHTLPPQAATFCKQRILRDWHCKSMLSGHWNHLIMDHWHCKTMQSDHWNCCPEPKGFSSSSILLMRAAMVDTLPPMSTDVRGGNDSPHKFSFP
jgi:hypothetical protein